MSKLFLYDVFTRKARVAQSEVVSIGSSASCRISSRRESVGAFIFRKGDWSFYPACDLGTYSVSGQQTTNSTKLEKERPTMFAVDGALFIALDSEQENPVALYYLNPESWYVYDEAAKGWKGPSTPANLYAMQDKLRQETFLSIDGCNDLLSYCTYGDFMSCAKANNLVQPQVPAAKPQEEESAAERRARMLGANVQEEEDDAAEDGPEIDELEGKYICPVCWLHFNIGDVMSIANHPDLMGDKILGRGAMKRFWATRFNALGQALDEKGVPCRDIACPHCRRKLPPQYLNLKGHIFSIIGAPSSGKSYYLTSLVHEMETTIAAETSIVWQDSDPSDNSMLNDAINRLFSADTPWDAYLTKTDLEGALYEEFYRHGRMVKLPRPFVFNVTSDDARSAPVSVVFYDNAGEHFEPGRNSDDSPGAQHVAVASGLFFLYDPTTCRAMRKQLQGKDDPQLRSEAGRMDQQITILRETMVRINSILNLPPGKKIDTPLAIMIGKSDLWEDSLESGALLPSLTPDGKIITANIDKNSAVLRSFLKRFEPSICTYAEQLSTNVRYFAVSSLGCSPVSFTDPATGVVKIGPDPAKVAPKHVADPVLWILNQLEPGIVPSAR